MKQNQAILLKKKKKRKKKGEKKAERFLLFIVKETHIAISILKQLDKLGNLNYDYF